MGIVESLYSLAESLEKIVREDNKYSVIIGDKKVATASYYDYSMKDFDWILIADVVTDPEYRGRGYATKLMNRLEEDVFEENPGKGLYLLVEQSNKAAINLYKKLDYKFVKEYSIEDTPYYVMCKGNADINQLKEMNFS